MSARWFKRLLTIGPIPHTKKRKKRTLTALGVQKHRQAREEHTRPHRGLNAQRRKENRMIASPAFPNLAEIMMQKRLSCHAISLRTGIEEHTVLKSLRGQRELKLWEAIAIKNAVGSDLPIEKMFQRKFNI